MTIAIVAIVLYWQLKVTLRFLVILQLWNNLKLVIYTIQQ